MVPGLGAFAAECPGGRGDLMDRTPGRILRGCVPAEDRDLTICLEPDRFPLIISGMCGWDERLGLKGESLRNLLYWGVLVV